jgi:hypothetical protein
MLRGPAIVFGLSSLLSCPVGAAGVHGPGYLTPFGLLLAAGFALATLATAITGVSERWGTTWSWCLRCALVVALSYGFVYAACY